MITLPLIQHHFPTSTIHEEIQNQEYEGCSFIANGFSYRSRLAKKTPKKQVISLSFGRKMRITKIPLIHSRLLLILC